MEKSNGLGSVIDISREKFWSELNDSEKIERLRSELKRAIRMANDALSEAYSAKRVAKEHAHLDGKVVVSAHDADRDTLSTGGRFMDKGGNEVYI